jgi:hypothetical protein
LSCLPLAIIFTDICMPLSLDAHCHDTFRMRFGGSIAVPDLAMPHRNASIARADRMDAKRRRARRKDCH